MKQYYTPDGIVNIEMSDRELYESLLTGWVHNLPDVGGEYVYEEGFLRLLDCPHIYFMQPDNDDFPANTFEYAASEFLKHAHSPRVFRDLIAIVKNLEVRPNDVLVKVVTLDPKNEHFAYAHTIANRKQTIDEFLLHNE